MKAVMKAAIKARIRDFCRCTKAMTIIELVVAMLILALVAASVSAIVAPALKAYGRSNTLAELNSLVDNLAAEIVSDMGSALAVNISGGTLTISTGMADISYDVRDGLLRRDGQFLFEEGYYGGSSLNLQVLDDALQNPGPTTSAFIIRLEVVSDQGVSLSRDYAVRPLGMNSYLP